MDTVSISLSGKPGMTNIKAESQHKIEKLGYDYFNHVAYFPMSDVMHEVSSFPKCMSLNGDGPLLSSSNPVSTLSQSKTCPFMWKDMIAEPDADLGQIDRILKSAKINNVHDGLCVPVHGVGSEWGMLNVARAHVRGHHSPEAVDALRALAVTTQCAIKRANSYDMKERYRVKVLSSREKECLDWIAAGKTAWETAQIIGISESTVAFHTRNIINKLNANNRSHAVALAMAHSLITGCGKTTLARL